MGEALHYEWPPSSTNSWDSGLLPQDTQRIPGYRLPVVGVYWQYSTALVLLVYAAVVLFVALWARRQLQHLSEHGCRTGDSGLGGDISSRSQVGVGNRPVPRPQAPSRTMLRQLLEKQLRNMNWKGKGVRDGWGRWLASWKLPARK
ncbi:hypothetical protein ENH_00024080 [Eimeria necatrix]|uniref:Uncharacterized protein n=1 Tax=Eimeria necatrix TaxID=51315 RepID=U6MW32_9EIME|nr:hypothetical protein ENH_00024080 [Eimeria necatrix]CDJ66694.1 hypothetical protein ENH_00024080 [Eimeria necatrix]